MTMPRPRAVFGSAVTILIEEKIDNKAAGKK